MSVTVPEREPLGASTLVRKWWVDVETAPSPDGGTTPATWAGVFGITSFVPTHTKTLQDDSDFDSDGWGSQTSTAQQWGATLTVSRKVQTDAPTAYDPGQEFLRAAAQNVGPGASVTVRFYEMTPDGPRVEAYQGQVTVDWSPVGGAQDALDTVNVTLTGQGKRESIAHPAPTV